MNDSFISKLTFIKELNFLKTSLSFFIARFFKYPFHCGMPISISIEPTNYCNLHCPECPTGLRKLKRENGYMNFDLFCKIVDELKPYLTNLILYFQGEPYLHSDLFEMIKYASSRNIYTSLSTNGHFLNESNALKTIESELNRIIISIDGTTQDVYSKYRVGGNLNKVISGILNLSETKYRLKSDKLKIVLQFLVFKTNEHQIQDIIKLKKYLKADKVILKSAQIYDFEKGNQLIPENIDYSRYIKNQNGTYSIKNKLKNHCWRLWNSAVITWDGNVLPCCFDKDAQFIMGNISNDNFKTIWKNTAFKQFRTQILVNRKNIDMCKNCTEGLKEK